MNFAAPSGLIGEMSVQWTAALLEREEELAIAHDALADAERRRGRVVLVEAAPGLGKTSLLRAFGEIAAEEGFTVVRARATELERDFAFGCVRQLLDPVVASASDADRDARFSGAAALARCLFIPCSDDRQSDEPSMDGRFAMLHGLYWLINDLAADGPLAVLADDVQWADPESLGFLSYLAARLDGLPLVVLATARPGEGDVAGVVRLAAGTDTAVVRPRPLSLEAIGALCRRMLGDDVSPEFVAACGEATGGNPFFVEELLREAAERRISTDARDADEARQIGPSAVARAVLLRLSGRPQAATELVNAVAVLGDGAALGEAAELARLSEGEAAEAADVLVRLAILKQGDGLEFAHGIVRAAVCRDLGPIERARAHAVAARILSRRGAPEERIAAQIAAAEPSGDPGRVELLRRVAMSALARGAPAAAVSWLRRAMREPPPPESMVSVLLELGSAELRLGSPEAVDRLQAAVDRIEEPGMLAIASRQLALALAVAGQSNRAVGVLEGAIDALEPDDRELALLLESELASHAHQASGVTQALAVKRLERHQDLAGRTRGERLVLASRAYERARASDSAEEAAVQLNTALDGGRLLRDLQLDLAGPLYWLVIGLLPTDSLDVAEASVEQALAEARERGAIPPAAFLTTRRGWIALRRGWVGRAEADARTGVQLLKCHKIPLGMPFAVALLIRTLIELGELDEADAVLRERGLGVEIPLGPGNNFLFEARAMLRLAQGRSDEAFDGLMEFGRLDEQWGGAHPVASRWRSQAALALALMGDSEGACALAAEDLQRARRWGAASGIGIALRASALVDAGEAQTRLLRDAAEVLERSPARLEYVRALADLGGALRRANQRADARGVLESALALANRLGARALSQRASIELRAAGGRSSDPNGVGTAQLTASELRVAELAATGQTNPEIAQALFVTRKTVETHLGHVYAKLGISGRGELHLALASSGT